MAMLSRALVEAQVGPEWTDLLMPFMASEHMDKILLKLRELRAQGKLVIPDSPLVFQAFRETPLSTMRVIILGQDPYPRKEHATGIAFGCPQALPEPASLTQMLNAVEIDCYGGLNLQSRPDSRDKTLLSWAKQGVLMLNIALTTEDNNAGAHIEIWKPFTEYVVSALQEIKRGLIFMSWGSFAQEFTKDINLYLGDHHLLTAEHPVKAAYEKRQWLVNHFSRANAIIIANKRGEPIQWL